MMCVNFPSPNGRSVSLSITLDMSHGKLVFSTKSLRMSSPKSRQKTKQGLRYKILVETYEELNNYTKFMISIDGYFCSNSIEERYHLFTFRECAD